MSSDGPEAHPSSVPSQFSSPEALRSIAFVTMSLPVNSGATPRRSPSSRSVETAQAPRKAGSGVLPTRGEGERGSGRGRRRQPGARDFGQPLVLNSGTCQAQPGTQHQIPLQSHVRSSNDSCNASRKWYLYHTTRDTEGDTKHGFLVAMTPSWEEKKSVFTSKVKKIKI